MSSSKFKINNKELLRALGIAETTRGRNNGSFQSPHSFFQESDSIFEMTKHFDNSISYNIEDENQEDRGDFLFSLDIDITHDTKDFLAVYTKDKPYELAMSFCDKHGIEPEIADVIAARIVENAKQTLINRETLMMNCQPAVSDSDETNEEERVTYDENQMLPKGGDDDSVDDVYSPSIRENYKNKIMSEKEMNFESAAKTVFTTEIKEMKPYEVLTSGADEGISRFIGSTKDTRKSSSFAQGFTEENASPMKSQQSKRTSRDKFYEKTLRDIENRVRKDAIITEIHNEEKYKECTFHPNLNPISLRLAGNRKRDVSTEDLLLLKGKISEEKRAMRKQTARSKENRNNTFKPELNDMSKCLEEKNRPNYNQKERFEDLYQEYKVLHEKRNQLKAQMVKEYPFAPNTCNTKRTDKDGPNFLERLAEDIEQRKIKKASEEEEQQESLPTFCPKILKNVPHSSRNLEKLPVGVYLYNMAIDIENKKAELREEFERELRAKAPKCSEKSAQITQARIKKNLQHIFEALDIDKDGLIATDQITLETIPKDLAIMLEPIFNGLKDLNCQQNANQFLEACLELLRNVDPIIKSFWALDFSKKHSKDRNELLQEREQEIGMIFHPKIDQKSKQMVGNEDPRQGRSVHQRLYTDKARSEVRLKEMKEKKDKEELKECSFRPVINKYPGGTETYYQKVFAGLDTSI